MSEFTSENLEQIFKMENFFDELSVIDMEGITRYCKISEPDTSNFTADEVIGKNYMEFFNIRSKEESEIWRVLTTGKPIMGFEENCVTYRGDIIHGLSSIFPIYKGGMQIGAAVALKFIGDNYGEETIKISDNDSTRKQKGTYYVVEDLLGNSSSIESIKGRILRVAQTESAVLIEGETGTGKEIVAQAIHSSGKRSIAPFISQNCAAIPDNLIESILFGTERGAFTGAVTSEGLFELANGGTLFLDEINSMNVYTQSKLLKSIEDKHIRRIGGKKNIELNVRIIAALNESPEKAIKENRLRRDLFYRLNVATIKLPPLRDRTGDIDYLADVFIKRYNRSMTYQIYGISDEARNVLNRYQWPGNVRELQNTIEGLYNMTDSDIVQVEDIPEYIRVNVLAATKPEDMTKSESSMASKTFSEIVTDYERTILLQALSNNPSRTKAAASLGLTKQSLNYHLDKLGIKNT